MKKVFLPVLLAAMFSVAAVESRPVKVVLFPFREAEIAYAPSEPHGEEEEGFF